MTGRGTPFIEVTVSSIPCFAGTSSRPTTTRSSKVVPAKKSRIEKRNPAYEKTEDYFLWGFIHSCRDFEISAFWRAGSVPFSPRCNLKTVFP